MRTLMLAFLSGLFSFGVSVSVHAESVISDERLRESFHDLSASTLVDGAGWQAYESVLHPAYSRWAMGEVYEGRQKFIDSLKEWWEYGMRVSSRDIELVGVDIADDFAVIRFKTTESFVGPDGPTEGFSGYVSNIWIRDNGDWKLFAAEIYSTQREDVSPVRKPQ